MNYALFLSIGVFASLLLVISLQLGISSPTEINVSPQKIVAVIKADNRRQSFIARQKLNLPKKNTHIATSPNTKLILPTNIPFPKPKKGEESPLFASDTFVQFLIQQIKTALFFSP